MSDKTTEEAASLRIGDLLSALIDANTTIAQLREENERLKNQWISASQPPTVGEDYNVVLDLKDNMGPPVSGIMEFCGVTFKWLYPGTEIICNDVIYWAPLPPPPTEALTPKPPKIKG